MISLTSLIAATAHTQKNENYFSTTIYKISNNLECQIIPSYEIETNKIIRYS